MSTDTELTTLPLHAKPVQPLSIDRLRELMLPHVRRRFDEVWNFITRPNTPEREVKTSRLHCTTQDADTLLAAGLAELVTPEMLQTSPTLGEVEVFTCTEERPTGARRRFISWARQDNAALEGKYTPQVPLKHISHYLDAASHNFGGKRDLMVGFYQLELPEAARAKFRFRDKAGRLLQHTRMLMGHTAAAEEMHTTTSVIAGDPAYVKPEYAFWDCKADVYMDGIRPFGQARQVQQILHRIDTRAQFVGATFNDDSMSGTTYVFNGVAFDHDKHTVAVGPKLLDHLRSVQLDIISAEDLESVTARLIHASSILNIPLPQFYWVLKFVRRILSKLNRGIIDVTERVVPPPAVLTALKRWMTSVLQNEPVQPRLTAQTATNDITLFTDASKDGWGAFFIDKKGEIFLAGAPWAPKYHYEVNAAEMHAVSKALTTFANLTPVGTHVHLFVDNTSTEICTRKGHSKSEGVSTHLLEVIKSCKEQGIMITPNHVATGDNPADPVSRGVTNVWRKGR